MSEGLGKVSVIVPVYNVENYFDECINSILHQTYEDLEIIIIDDGSTDSCAKKADEYADDDERIRVFHKENGGPALARNLGLEHATGEYCCFIDSDDYCESDYVEKLIDTLVKNDADMVFCNYFSCYTDKNVPGGRFAEIGSGGEFAPDDYLKRLYSNGAYSFIWNKIYKRDIFHDLRFKNMLGEDAQIMLYIIDQCKKIWFLPDALYHYRRRKSSVMNTKQESMLIDEISWIKDHMDRLEATGRQSLYDLAQKLYVRKIIEKYHFCSKKTRRDRLKPLLKKEIGRFMHNPGIDAKLRLKYFAVSLIPYLYSKISFHETSYDLFWE